MGMLLLIGMTMMLAPCPSSAQSAMLTLPDVSQHARVMQRIGLTDITVDYHRPMVAGRKIFGGVQPYGRVWRAGANNNTTIEFTDSVKIEGRPLAKGTYGLHMIPGDSSWIVIFSRNSTSWGSFYYDSTEDALRVTVRPRTIPLQEVLTYGFDDPTANSVVVTMRWERTAVPFRIDIDVPHLVARSLRDQLRGRIGSEWQPYTEVANYLLENDLDAREALADAEQSIEIEDRFENEITRARALTALGRADEARAAQARALTLGTQFEVYEFARALQRVGQQKTAIEIYRTDVKRHPGTPVTHEEAARVAVAAGDYDGAIAEMKRALAATPTPGARRTYELMLGQLQHHVDINR
jgi:hypothetical protein